ncbi:Alpha/beta hydrolase fold-3 [Artemisia annua]|uniref:Alpha/beta hydrolase fold-3 n=1 Tax=Artemisia annua TaxID=35608 RepID=A0A2U1Q8X9_ARTAN|nr:Alpha/beta hydrolase fold-3 [Artemisia annua]
MVLVELNFPGWVLIEMDAKKGFKDTVELQYRDCKQQVKGTKVVNLIKQKWSKKPAAMNNDTEKNKEKKFEEEFPVLQQNKNPVGKTKQKDLNRFAPLETLGNNEKQEMNMMKDKIIEDKMVKMNSKPSVEEVKVVKDKEHHTINYTTLYSNKHKRTHTSLTTFNNGSIRKRGNTRLRTILPCLQKRANKKTYGYPNHSTIDRSHNQHRLKRRNHFTRPQNLRAPLHPVSAAKKLPLIIYIHGGAFTIESAFSTLYHTHLNSLTAAAEAISISIEYRLAPEHVVLACYNDCWEALKWVEQQSDTWIKDHADLNRVFLVGDSAGANIAHNLAVRAGVDRVNLNIVGMILVHPYFEFAELGKLWMYICPGSSGVSDPRINPAAEPGLIEKIVCGKVLVCVAGSDTLKDRGVMYHELLKNSGWNGDVEIVETEGEDHVFHLFKPDCEAANKFVALLASFINQHCK